MSSDKKVASNPPETQPTENEMRSPLKPLLWLLLLLAALIAAGALNN